MDLLGMEITGAERFQCPNYYDVEVGVTAFQSKEADVFNEVLAAETDDWQPEQPSTSEDEIVASGMNVRSS